MADRLEKIIAFFVSFSVEPETSGQVDASEMKADSRDAERIESKKRSREEGVGQIQNRKVKKARLGQEADKTIESTALNSHAIDTHRASPPVRAETPLWLIPVGTESPSTLALASELTLLTPPLYWDNNVQVSSSGVPFWPQQSLKNFGIIGEEQHKPSTLTEWIHPILEKPNWRNLSQHFCGSCRGNALYEAMKPALVLASKFLDSDAAIEFFATITSSSADLITGVDGVKEFKYVEPTPIVMAEVRKKLQILGTEKYIDLSFTRHPSRVQSDSTTEYVECNSQRQSLSHRHEGPPRRPQFLESLTECEYVYASIELGSQFHDFLQRLSKCDECRHLSHDLPPPTPDAVQRAHFKLATILVHEITHAIFDIRFNGAPEPFQCMSGCGTIPRGPHLECPWDQWAMWHNIYISNPLSVHSQSSSRSQEGPDFILYFQFWDGTRIWDYPIPMWWVSR